jgi:hypothetical protein
MNQSNTLHAVRIDTHRVTLMPEACADEGGVPHEPVLARPRRNDGPAPRGYFWWLLVLALDLVAAIAMLVIALGPR